jgi:hypothetical protein
MSGVFSDADGDTLALSVSSSDTQIVGFTTAFDGSPTAVTAVTVIAAGPGTATITITAQDSDGNQVSDAFDVTVPDAQQLAIAVPGPVIDLTLTPKNSGIEVSWTAPEVGGAPTRYIVHLRPEDGEHGSGKTKQPKAKKTKVTFDDIEPGTTYQVWVRARNALGKGERVYATITLPEAQPE